MSNFRSFSPSTMLSTSSIIWQNVTLTDELKIGLEYDIQHGFLNIFIKNNDSTNQLPCHINVLSNRSQECELASTRICENNSKDIIMFDDCLHSSNTQQDNIQKETSMIFSNDKTNQEMITPKICIEISTIYTYDLYDEIENTDQCQSITIATSPSFSSSSIYSDDDDGYSTHSHDDIEQQQQQQKHHQTPSNLIISPYRRQSSFSVPYVSPVRQLIGQLMWLSPFSKTMQQMMMNHV